MKIHQTNTYKKFVHSPRTNNPDKIIVHHSGGTDKNPLADTSHHTAKMMEEWHLSKGWDGLGYQYVIHKDGEIWAGRPEHRHGAHCVNQNQKSIGICLSGNFDLTIPTLAQEESLKSLLKDIQSRYTIKEIVPHRKYSNKSCFGNKLTDSWASDLLKEKDSVSCSLSNFTLMELAEELQKRISEFGK